MLSIKVFGLLALTFVIAHAEITMTINRCETFPKAEVTSDLHDGLLTYVTCYSLLDTKLSTTKCKITHSALYGANELASCEVTLNGKEDAKVNVFSINADSAIITWYSKHDSGPEYFIRYTIVHFNGCKINEVRIGFDDLETVAANVHKYGNALLINEDDTFDVFFESSRLCGSRACKVRLDAEGKIVEQPTASFTPIENFSSEYTQIEPKSVNDTFVISELDKTARILLVTPNGQQLLKEMDKSKLDLCSVSTRNHVIRVCVVTEPKSKISCEVYDISGKLVSKITVDIGHEISKLFLYNLANGEFIALTLAKYDNNMIHFTKVDSNGRRVGALQLPKLKCAQDKISSYADLEYYGRYCSTKLCYGDNHVELRRKCFDDEDF